MAILPSEVKSRSGWDKTSAHPIDPSIQVPNKETSMPWSEHQRIVAESAKLLVGDAVPEIFHNLRIALGIISSKKPMGGEEMQEETATIYVSKGIHQPQTNPHMQIETETKTIRTKGKGRGKTTRESKVYIQRYHLNVSVEVRKDITGMSGRFTWQGVQYTALDSDGKTVAWPVGVSIFMKLPTSDKMRRNSVSGSDYAEKVAQIAKEIEKAKLDAAFDELCKAFEKEYDIEPIDRTAFKNSVWKPYTVKPKNAKVKAFNIKYVAGKGINIVN